MTAGRGVGAIETLQRVLPDWGSEALILVTQLGDVWFAVGLVTLVYWFHDRRAGAAAIGTVLGALALTVGLKALFALPRPPPTVRLIDPGGYGFPSGHAITSTVAWGVLALALGVWTRRRRLAVAALVVALVSVSRVGLGVHYAVDVIAGVFVGATYLALVRYFAGDDPFRAGGVAAVVALAGVAVGGGSDAVMLLGGTLGALAAWRVVDVPAEPWDRTEVVPALVGTVVVGAALAAGYGGPVSPPLAFVIGAVAVAVVVALPALVERAVGWDSDDTVDGTR